MFLITRDAVVTHIEFEKSEQRAFVMNGIVYDELDDIFRAIEDEDIVNDMLDIIKDWYISKWGSKLVWHQSDFVLSDLLSICPYELQYCLDKIKKATSVDIEYCGIQKMKEFIGLFENVLDIPELDGMSVTQLPPTFY